MNAQPLLLDVVVETPSAPAETPAPCAGPDVLELRARVEAEQTRIAEGDARPRGNVLVSVANLLVRAGFGSFLLTSMSGLGFALVDGKERTI